MSIAFFQRVTPGQTKCFDVVLTPDSGFTPRNVDMLTPQIGGHIFYTLTISGTPPTHTADAATGSTVRVGSNHGAVSTGTGSKQIQAICYKAGLEDSNISYGFYEPL